MAKIFGVSFFGLSRRLGFGGCFVFGGGIKVETSGLATQERAKACPDNKHKNIKPYYHGFIVS